MLFLIAILLFVVLLGLYSAGVAWHRRRLKREAERSAVWQADEDFHRENPGMAFRYWKPESWEQFDRKIIAACQDKRRCDVEIRSRQEIALEQLYVSTYWVHGIIFAKRHD